MDTAKVAAHYGLPEQDVIDERNWRLGLTITRKDGEQ